MTGCRHGQTYWAACTTCCEEASENMGARIRELEKQVEQDAYRIQHLRKALTDILTHTTSSYAIRVATEALEPPE